MILNFHKYQGTGNDFIMIDNRNGQYDNLTIPQISQLCDRRFGIGADGLIKINKHNSFDFEVDYYNADGSKSFCGNGARCAVMFAQSLGINVESTNFLGIDGKHNAVLDEDGLVHLEMNDVQEIEILKDAFVLNTGSPHHVAFSDDLSCETIVSIGKEIRYSDAYKAQGINVNLMQLLEKNSISIATYERGVEDETLSCGTGATACAMVYAVANKLEGKQLIEVKVKGGNLKVSFNASLDGKFTDVRLIGPATFVYQGEVNV